MWPCGTEPRRRQLEGSEKANGRPIARWNISTSHLRQLTAAYALRSILPQPGAKKKESAGTDENPLHIVAAKGCVRSHVAAHIEAPSSRSICFLSSLKLADLYTFTYSYNMLYHHHNMVQDSSNSSKTPKLPALWIFSVICGPESMELWVEILQKRFCQADMNI